MVYAKLNGLALDAAPGGSSVVAKPVGDIGRAWTNRPLRREYGHPSEHNIMTTLNTQGAADTLESLVAGRGDSLHFTDGPTSVSGRIFDPTTPAGDLFLSDDSQVPGHPYCVKSTTADAVLNPEFKDAWTVMMFVDAALSTFSHKIARSDGGRWEGGERNDALNFGAYFVVDAGAVALTSAALTDGVTGIVLLPYAASDDAVASFYDFITGYDLSFRASFEGTADSIDNTGLIATMTGHLEQRGHHVGPSGTSRSAEFVTAEVADYGTASPQTDSSAEPGMSWEWWGIVDAAAGVTPGHAFSKTDGVTAAGYLIGHTGVFAGVLNWGVIVAYAGGVFPYAVTTDSPVAVDEWHHFVVTWDEVAGAFLLYLDGRLQATTDADAAPGIPLNDDSALDFGVGNDVGDTLNPWNGRIQDARIYKRTLSASVIAEKARAGNLFGRALPGAQPFPDAPRIILDGEIVGFVPREVLGRDGGQSIRQAASKADGGWQNNVRDVPVALSDVNVGDTDAVPIRPTISLIHNEIKYKTASSFIHTRDGDGTRGVLTGAQTWVRGPFGRGRARDITSSATYTTVPNLSGVLPGAHLATFGAWVKQRTSAVRSVILSASLGASARLELGLTSANRVEMRGKSEGADALQALVPTVALVVPNDEWIFVGGGFDLDAGSLFAFVWSESAGSMLEEALATFGAATFSDETSTNSRIGQDTAGANPFDGPIASVYAWVGRAFDVRDVSRMGAAGRRGKI